MIIDPIERKINVKFKNMDDLESHKNALDVEYDTDDVTFTGYVFIINIPQFNVVKRSTYAKGTNYMKKIVEYYGQNCYIPTYGMCSIKCSNCFTKKDYTEEFLSFIRIEKYRSGVMTSGRFQPFCKKYYQN